MSAPSLHWRGIDSPISLSLFPSDPPGFLIHVREDSKQKEKRFVCIFSAARKKKCIPAFISFAVRRRKRKEGGVVIVCIEGGRDICGSDWRCDLLLILRKKKK